MKPNKIQISKIKTNPNNPRIIKDYKFKKLINSIKEFPEMLKLRPIVVDEKNIILGGNMRYKACVQAGLKEIYVIQADNLTEEQKKEFIIKDNSSFGEWDWDIIANEWDTEEIKDWGLEIKTFGENIAEAEWIGMPEFSQEDLMPKNQLIVSFANDEDRKIFAELICQKITDKTKSVWFPLQEKDLVKNLRY
jgi:hypothetical protein